MNFRPFPAIAASAPIRQKSPKAWECSSCLCGKSSFYSRSVGPWPVMSKWLRKPATPWIRDARRGLSAYRRAAAQVYRVWTVSRGSFLRPPGRANFRAPVRASAGEAVSRFRSLRSTTEGAALFGKLLAQKVPVLDSPCSSPFAGNHCIFSGGRITFGEFAPKGFAVG